MILRHQQAIMKPRRGGGQSVDYTETAGTISTGITEGVYVVKVNVSTEAYVTVFGKEKEAATTDCYCLPNVDYFFPINPGGKVSAIQVSSGGTLYVCEMTQ